MGSLILFHPDALRVQAPIRDHLEHWGLIAPPAASSPTPSPPILPHDHLLLLSAVSVKCHLPLLISKHPILLLLLGPQQLLLLLPSNHPRLPAPLPLSSLLLFLCLSENTTFCFSCCIECAAIKIFMNCRLCCCLC